MQTSDTVPTTTTSADYELDGDVDALFTIDTSKSEQWRLERLLLCNWGGFGGITEIRLHPESTLLSGASGAGKSTILDAFTSLLNPKQPFNVASNDAGVRRGEGTRTTLTYVRGQYDRIERDGDLIPRVLRGDGQDTWSALAAVFASTTGARFTALRLFFAPQEATSPGDLSTVYATLDGSLERHHIDVIEPLAEKAFRKDLLEKTVPGLRIANQSGYAEAVQAKLHIGAVGEGAKAVRLLHELQAGKPQPSIDALFKQTVLERPITFREADAAVESFDKLDQGYREIVTKEQQADALANIEADHAALLTAQGYIAQIDTLRISDLTRSPFLLWAYRAKADLYRDEIELEHEEQLAADADSATWAGQAEELAAQLADVEQQYREGGGAALETLNRTLDGLVARRATAERTRESFLGKTVSVIEEPKTDEQFADAQQQARAFLASQPATAAALRKAKEALYPDFFALKQVIRDDEAELEHLKKHTGNIPRTMHLVRLDFARAANLEPADLPFAGELVDMREEHEQWRAAADAVLGGFARTLLVDERHRFNLSRAIDGMTTDIRLHYLGVPINRSVPSPAPEATLSGRLQVKDGPFTGWLREHLDHSFAFECVETADQLGSDGAARVTRSGQTRRGRQGAHGGNRQRVIGFSNVVRQQELQDKIAWDQRRRDDLEAEVKQIEGREIELATHAAAWAIVAETTWLDIDLAGLDERIAENEKARDRLLDGQGALAVLEDQRKRLKGQVTLATETATRRRVKAEGHEKKVQRLSAEASDLDRALEGLEADGTIRLTEDQAADLDTRLGQLGDWDGSLDGFDTARRALQRELENALTGAKKDLEAAAQRLTSAFTLFQATWPDNNRHVGLESYEDYLAILDDLRGHALAAQRENWSRKVVEYSGDRLSVLRMSYDRARDEISERQRPIREILARIPFGHTDRRLDIKVDHRRSEMVGGFQRQLAELASGAMNPVMDDDAVTAKFEAIRSTIARIREGSLEREPLLDVRRHLKVTAQVLDELGLALSAYDHIGDKSGGEAQMITAFICGAALRYQLGDQERDRPRYAPVVLDEAFIKADGRYTASAVDAWMQFGFQLVVGAPEDKFNSIEPTMGLVIGITKDEDHHSYAVHAPRKSVVG